MAKKEREKFSPPALGGSSLLVVFAVLSLTVFALLSLSTVRADRRLGERSAQAAAEYYAADARAQELLARLRGGQMPEGVVQDGDLYRYRCPISASQTLEVEVQKDGGTWRVRRWQAVYTGEWRPDEDLEVWEGQEEEN